MDLDEALGALCTDISGEAWRRDRPEGAMQRKAQTEVCSRSIPDRRGVPAELCALRSRDAGGRSRSGVAEAGRLIGGEHRRRPPGRSHEGAGLFRASSTHPPWGPSHTANFKLLGACRSTGLLTSICVWIAPALRRIASARRAIVGVSPPTRTSHLLPMARGSSDRSEASERSAEAISAATLSRNVAATVTVELSW